MKSLYIFIVTVVVIPFLTPSCKRDFLDVVPKDQLTDATFWKTENDAYVALMGCYRDWQSYYTVVMRIDMMSDIAYSKFPTLVQVMGNGQMSAASPGESFFGYTQIRKYNNFLTKVDAIDMPEVTKTEYKAEVRFLRAYDYWQKAQYYGDVPLVTTLFDDPEEAKVSRTPRAEVISFVLSELQEIIPTLPVKTMRETGGRATRGAALALKARCELFEEMYPEAMASAQAILDMGIFELFPDYNGLFDFDNENSNKESIMELVFVENDRRNDLWIDVTAGNDGGGYAVVCPTENLVASYEMANGKTIDDPTSGYDPAQPFMNRDPRFAMTILHAGMWYNGRYWNPFVEGSIDHYLNAIAFRSAYGFRKFAKIVNPSIVTNCGQNMMLFRLAEIYLIYAEAAIESNQLTENMYNAIDAVRLRAGMPAVDRGVYNTQATLRELVRRERKVELCFEGLRYYDVKRWDLGPQVLNGTLYGSPIGTVDPATGHLTLGAGRVIMEERIFHPERNYLLPIPQSALDANPNLEQNPGY